MKTPQLKNGYTKIENEILSALARFRIPGEQMQVLIFIFRKTYGWNKKDDCISLSQFVNGTGIRKPNICRALNELCKKRIIIKKDNNCTTNYRFNKKYDEWIPLSKKITLKPLSKVITNVIKSDNNRYQKRDIQKKVLKENNKRKTPINPSVGVFLKEGNELTTEEKADLLKKTRERLKNGSLANEGS